MARAVMVLGTSSHVGKSLLTAALCRIFAQQGYRVAPFKAQNMSLNSAATVEGLEIGRAQALQAQAARIPCSVHMNPLLINPTGDKSSQIVVRGKIWRRMDAADYFQARAEELLPIVRESYEWLSARNDVVVLEGAGSPAEINLKSRDIVNMRMAALADAQCILVGDIDRGGVFASLLGTIELLDPEERARIRGFIINKFRGDLTLLLPGIRQIEDRIGKPCLGVVPYLGGLSLEEEDSLGLDARPVADWQMDVPSTLSHRRLRIAVVCLPSLANFTDFDPLSAEPSVSLKYCRKAAELELADIVLIPGSKETVKDLAWMRAEGFERAVLRHHARGGLTVGICGGMQILGQEILDPEGIETAGSAQGLGLLAMRTSLQQDKITVNARGALCEPELFGQSIESRFLQGYEIHVGETEYLPQARPFATLLRASQSAGGAAADDTLPNPNLVDGCISEDSRTFGTYLHGIFDHDAFRHGFVRAACGYYRLTPGQNLAFLQESKERDLDRLAETVRRTIDLEAIFHWIGFAYDRGHESRVPGLAYSGRSLE
jgi:adenosylcobyric acid synthase